jgi:hypothetical protein
MSGEDHRFNRVKEEFRDWETLQWRLTEIGENEWINYVPFDSGEPGFEPSVEDWVSDVMSEHDIEGFFSRVREPDDGEEPASADELLDQGAGLILEIDVADINDELVRYLAAHPEKMREMEPRKFEELVAELFEDKGYDVEVTPRSKDGGLDIRVFHKSELGCFLTLVECKRYGESKRVGVDCAGALRCC